ncbi:unnamed protein product [Polarella glacialis]|uniref:Ion transport domain-containing protein n=1 Tax=Polarella glacialis TaxID=89957 RepID=A0A813ESS4_POLGL|nr:unnamed protein product [Polarella glacialis]
MASPALKDATWTQDETYTRETTPEFDTQQDVGESSGQTRSSTFTQKVNLVELGLSKILADCRRQMEDVMDRHHDGLEEIQTAHDLELGKLRAENAMLRERLSLSKNPDSKLQVVLFQTKPPPPVNVKGKRSEHKKTKASSKINVCESPKQRGRNRMVSDDDQALASICNRRAAKKAEGGTWQNFVAWVPNSAALQTPEPWKPFQQPSNWLSSAVQGASQLALGVNPRKSFKSVKIRPSVSFAKVLPGSVGDDSMRDGSAESADEDGSEPDSKKGSGEDASKFELEELWKEKDVKGRKARTIVTDSEFDGDEGGAFSNQSPSIYIVNPDSNQRIAWDLGSMALVVYDMIMVPMSVFDIPEGAFIVMMEWVTRLFWTFDMGWSCSTGIVQEDGSVEYRREIILKRYAKSWLAMDLIIVLSDWLGLIASNGGMELTKLARISRVIRVVRLLRLARIQEVIANVMERIQSDRLGLVLQLLKPLVLLVSLSHVMACGWWAVSSDGVDDSSWIQQQGYKDSGFDSQYLICLHWALSQFAGGEVELVAATPLEHLYQLFVCILGFMASLIMLSNLTSSLTQMYIISGSTSRQMATLKAYLKQNHVQKNLIKRVCRNAKHALCGDLTPDAVSLLNVISEPLKVEMHYHMYSRILSWHPFFKDYLKHPDGSHVMRRVCHQAMSMLLLACGDVMFSLGEEPAEPKMYIVVSGSLQYLDAYGEDTIVRERQWVAEAVLWTQWRHKGTLTAMSDVRLAMLNVETFQHICKGQMRKQSEDGFNPRRYAAQFVEELNNSECVTDLYQPEA